MLFLSDFRRAWAFSIFSVELMDLYACACTFAHAHTRTHMCKHRHTHFIGQPF